MLSFKHGSEYIPFCLFSLNLGLKEGVWNEGSLLKGKSKEVSMYKACTSHYVKHVQPPFCCHFQFLVKNAMQKLMNPPWCEFFGASLNQYYTKSSLSWGVLLADPALEVICSVLAPCFETNRVMASTVAKKWHCIAGPPPYHPGSHQREKERGEGVQKRIQGVWYRGIKEGKEDGKGGRYKGGWGPTRERREGLFSVKS